MDAQIMTLGDALPMEIERVSRLRDEYLALPDGAGTPGAFLMRVCIQSATAALASGDIKAMLLALQDLKGWEE